MTRHGLIADIGGTNARFARVTPDGVFHDPLVLPCAEFPGPVEAARAYLERIKAPVQPIRGAFAVAAPILNDRVRFVNNPWDFGIPETRDALELDHLTAVNDFAALALALPRLGLADSRPIGGGAAVFGAPMTVLGPGTGLGVAAMVPGRTGWVALPTEGGHSTLAAGNDREAALIGRIRARFGHVSAERALSGPGLVHLHDAIREQDGLAPAAITPDQVTAKGSDRSCPICAEALDCFFGLLGQLASDVALLHGAWGGVFLAGGILPRLADRLAASAFRVRFEDKGRYRDFLKAVPSRLITHPLPAFVGLAGLIIEEKA